MRPGSFVLVSALSVLMTGVAQGAPATPAPPSCPNAAQYTQAGTKCTQANQSNDVDAQAAFCHDAALEAGQCAAAESGLARIIEIGNEASFAMMTGVAIGKQSGGNAGESRDWLRVAMALYRTLYQDSNAPPDIRAAAHKYIDTISAMPGYVDGPPPSSPPGEPAQPPR